MDWITGIQTAINYIEDNITEELDYEVIAGKSFSSSFHFQRVFSILCGYTLGEYIRNRRLSLAGAELSHSKEKVIDVAYKYGYDTPESFSKAFQKFHGITPSQARSGGANLKSFSRLSIKVTLEGGNTMHYKIEKKPAMVLTGYKKRFSGTPQHRQCQDHNFTVETRLNQAVLQFMAHDVDISYNVFSNFSDDGYDFHIAAYIGSESFKTFEEEMGSEIFNRFERITIPEGTYLVCETEPCMWPCDELEALYRRAVTEWIPGSGFELAEGPEVELIYWPYKENNDNYNSTRYAQLWLPVRKI